MKSVLHRLFSQQEKADFGSEASRREPAVGELGAIRAALEGDISAIALDDVFQLFDFAGMSGELKVRAPENSGFFFFDKGLLIFGMLTKNQVKLGEILLAEGSITSGQLDECLKVHREQGQQERLGNILLQHGYINQENLVASISRQVKAAVFEVLSWRKGRFCFYVNHAPGEEEILLRERVDSLLLEGMMHIDHNS